MAFALYIAAGYMSVS